MKLHDYRADERKAWEQYSKECDLAYKQHARVVRAEEDEWYDSWNAHVRSWTMVDGRPVEVTNEAGLRVYLVRRGVLNPAHCAGVETELLAAMQDCAGMFGPSVIGTFGVLENRAP